MSAALTPRVRKIVLCDEAISSEIEDEVFTLEGVRFEFGAGSFPFVRGLSVYLLLSYPRSGSFTGEVKLAFAEEDKNIRISRFTVDFDTNRTLDLAPGGLSHGKGSSRQTGSSPFVDSR